VNIDELLQKTDLQGMVIQGMTYHSPLPIELAQFYCYVEDAGHCILSVLPGREGPVENYVVPLPVKAVLRTGYWVENGYVYCSVPYDAFLGAVCDEDDYEYEGEDFGDTGNGLLVIQNDGMLITNTNYWTSDYVRRGYCFCSVNEGCVRLLLPAPTSSLSDLNDDVFAQTRYVIISRGKRQGRDAYEMLFEDGSSCPYVLSTLANQWDRAIPASDSGRTDIAFHVYRSGRLARRLTARYRFVKQVPCLKRW
jgi:hypothetical protein